MRRLGGSRFRVERGTELGYNEVVNNRQTVLGSAAFADAADWAVTVTARDRPFMVVAWPSIHATIDTAGGGVKYRLMRSDDAVNPLSLFQSPLAASGAGPNNILPLQPLRRRLQLARGTVITFRVQIGGVAAGIATFSATDKAPLCIQAFEV